ncbi:hypothetical protein HPB48_005962 [Haemaphysalis longicornis]|uniref:Uncharacterized protein n=1 Tax=Haemaphysalis longicornis TaxID=44386 RepID=A0A9J6FMJ3_HAELO|nr:hypothetical protein HPB48_005962 [Haemaphysalis longicornis]
MLLCFHSRANNLVCLLSANFFLIEDGLFTYTNYDTPVHPSRKPVRRGSYSWWDEPVRAKPSSAEAHAEREDWSGAESSTQWKETDHRSDGLAPAEYRGVKRQRSRSADPSLLARRNTYYEHWGRAGPPMFISGQCSRLRGFAADRRDLVSGHAAAAAAAAAALGPITSLSSPNPSSTGSLVGGSGASFAGGPPPPPPPPPPRLTPSSADFQPPYFPPPYNLPSQPQLDFHDPYGSHHLNSLAAGPQQYHQLHPAAGHQRGLSRRPEEDLLQAVSANMHLPAYGEGRRTEPTAYPRRPDVLVHPHHAHHHLTEQDLLGLHGAAGLPPGIVEDGQASPCSSDDGNDFLEVGTRSHVAASHVIQRELFVAAELVKAEEFRRDFICFDCSHFQRQQVGHQQRVKTRKGHPHA